MRELTEAKDLCLANGTLNPAAVGYTRSQRHRTNLRGWGRTKRWEYWGIITPTHVLGLTISSLDYAGVLQVYLHDREGGEELSQDAIVPLARGVVLPDGLPPFSASASGGGLELRFTDGADGTVLEVSSPRVAARLTALPGGEALGVVVPWSERLFQYTLKDVARRVGGTLTVDGRTFEVDPAESWAVLDRGRGRWPYSMTWNWGAGMGTVEGKRLGLQLGGKWTDGTGATENALMVNGRLHHLPEELRWHYELAAPTSPWRVEGERVRATLTPFHVRHARTEAIVIASDTYQAFGHWSGWAVDDEGVTHHFEGLVGWAEEARNRW